MAIVRTHSIVGKSTDMIAMTALYEADKLAHEEAVHNGGVSGTFFLSRDAALTAEQLIMYWYGVPDPKTGHNLATCIWQSRRHSVAASSRPHHIRAMQLAAASYEFYTLERHVLRKYKGETGVRVEPFVGGEVGW